MLHVFVETNWVVGFAAPAHHRLPAAVELLARASRGELALHLPAVCLAESRHPLEGFHPRHEADAIRQFLLWALESSQIDAHEDETVRRVLDLFESRVKNELKATPRTVRELRVTPGLEVFALNERMLDLATELTSHRLDLKPFDQAVLAGVLGRAEELSAGEDIKLAFCELDKDLQPWDKNGNPKRPLVDLYDERSVWVYGDFGLERPQRPDGWPAPRASG